MSPQIAAVLLLGLLCFSLPAPTEAQYSVKLVGSGGQSAASLYNSYAAYYGYSKDNVALTYTASSVEDALVKYEQNLVDFVGADTALDPEQFNGVQGLAQLPIVGLPLVIGYNLPTLLSTDSLVLSGSVLAKIWLGEITRWNDTAIASLNPNITARLPDADILTSFRNDSAVSSTTVLKRALNVFTNGAFARNGSLVDLPPVANGFSFGYATDTERINYVKTHYNSLTYLSSYEATNASLPYAKMVNAAGYTVTASQTAVQAAMTAYRPSIDNGDLTVDILNANGSASWPLSYISFALIPQNITTPDCSNIQELLRFFSWTQLNAKATAVASSLGDTSLINAYRRRLIDAMGTIYCNGQKAFKTAVLLGMGPPYTIYYTWVANYPSTAFKVQYTSAVSQTAITEMAAGDIDYAAISTELTAAQKQLMPDAEGVPTIGYGILPVYNISELVGYDPVIMDWQAISDIFLNKISMWNDPYLVGLNPHLAGLLPNKSITIVYQTDPSPVNSIMTEALSKMVPEWRETMGNSTDTLPYFPAQSSGRAVGASLVGNALLNSLVNLPYSFGFYHNLDVVTSRTLKAVSLYNEAGNVVRCNTTTISSTLHDRKDSIAPIIALTPGANSWPMVLVNYVTIHTSETKDCVKAGGLLDYLYWTQTDSDAADMATAAGVVVASTIASVKRRLLTLLANTTCGDGVAVSSLYGCIIDGTLCSDHGTCTNGACQCDSGWEGDYCNSQKSAGADVALIVGLSVAIPIVSLAFLVLVCALVALFVYARRNRRGKDDWEIDADELEMGAHLGTGGFGEVHRAMWKGTEVAVKMMSSANVTRDMERNFKDEVRVMTALRHPNVVLFMAASTKPPRMCIVMEFMTLGSLYDLLQNELVPDIPYMLKVKMAYQAAKGMHFLHSSGIVHRDLKSLNLLLDNKWNVKVSDFGLTKFKEDIKSDKLGGAMAGSVHWTAPEVLNETPGADLVLADVYSFGIILWELLTRQQPYAGLSPAAVAVAVIRDNLRPTIPDEHGAPAEFEALMTSCWNVDPVIRPAFLEIMTRLSTEMGAQGSSFKTGSSSTSSIHGMTSSWTASAGTRSSGGGNSSSSGGDSDGSMGAAGAVGAGARAPEGEVAIVFTDITRAASLWDSNAMAMRDATLLHNETLRAVLKKHGGYEVVFLRDRNSGEGSFCMAFQEASAALEWCMEVQQELLKVEWPAELVAHPGASEEWGDNDDRVLFKGLRVRMGVHWGKPRVVKDPMTRRVEYIGPVVNAAARITALTHGGQVLLSHAVFNKLKGTPVGEESKRIQCLGRFEMPDSPSGSKLFELKVRGLEARFFGGVSPAAAGDHSSSQTHTSADDEEDRSQMSAQSGSTDGAGGGELQTAVGEGMMFKEDNFLTSANLCRWVIDFGEVQLGRQVGLGSYGVVYRGKWKGVDVAVKRFIKQKLDERRMLEFRAEMAFLSELHHPNIVLFIGACVKRPNLCIVTEFVKQGSLQDILSEGAVKLTFGQKLRMLRSAALGINYLHSLHPVIVHRDLKPSNLLVDENWNVKVADFGFARIKEENATMTRCGTPCWTAPEVIRGEKYSETADVYSFGIVMWQVLTRKQPFAGRNFMGVSLDVLEGRRPQVPGECPQVPGECPQAFEKVMKKCWHADAHRRPSMETVVAFFDSALGEEDSASPALDP